MAGDRDVQAFDQRSAGYERGRLGEWHHRIAERTADIALACTPAPVRVLDVGCGTGYLLRQFAHRCTEAIELSHRQSSLDSPGVSAHASGRRARVARCR